MRPITSNIYESFHVDLSKFCIVCNSHDDLDRLEHIFKSKQLDISPYMWYDESYQQTGGGFGVACYYDEIGYSPVQWYHEKGFKLITISDFISLAANGEYRKATVSAYTKDNMYAEASTRSKKSYPDKYIEDFKIGSLVTSKHIPFETILMVIEEFVTTFRAIVVKVGKERGNILTLGTSNICNKQDYDCLDDMELSLSIKNQ